MKYLSLKEFVRWYENAFSPLTRNEGLSQEEVLYEVYKEGYSEAMETLEESVEVARYEGYEEGYEEGYREAKERFVR